MNRGFFEGFYFKQTAPGFSLALIAAAGRDAQGRRFASIQAVLPDGSFTAAFPPEEASIDPAGPLILFGPNRLSASGLSVDLSGGGRTVRGALAFGPPAKPRGDIMGPFRMMPFMECRHRLVSMAHEVRGTLSVDGRARVFGGGLGYIEGDSGRSFPDRYLWTQCFAPSGEPRSIMLAVAEIPCAHTRFTGVVGCALYDGREIRLATYLGAQALLIRDGLAIVRQGGCTLTVRFDRARPAGLRAPVDGGLTRAVGERLSGRARYRMMLDGALLFDFTAADASFEYEYDR